MINPVTLLPDERVDDLQRNGLAIIQNPNQFCFGMDAVLLADFVTLRKHDRVVDLGTGTGILPILLSQNEDTAVFDAIEWQPYMAEMSGRSIQMNGLQDRICIHCDDVRNAHSFLGYETVSAVVSNPPYGKQKATIHSENTGERLSKHETDCTLTDFINAAAAILKNQGRFFVVFPANRLLDLLDTLRSKRLEPKRIRMVCSKASKPPYLVMIEAVKNAKPFLLWEKPLIVYNENGVETAEMDRIYHRI